MFCIQICITVENKIHCRVKCVLVGCINGHGSVKGVINCSVEYMIKSVHCAVLLVCRMYE